jgi:hypothetical protein
MTAVTPKSTPQASASHIGRIRRGPHRAAARQQASTAASTTTSGRVAMNVTVSRPPLGWATTRKTAIPAAQQMTPASMTQYGSHPFG